MVWNSVSQLNSKQFRCGYCGNIVATPTGFFDNSARNLIYICPHCDKPSYFDMLGNQVPGIAPGNEVENLPIELNALYHEARNSASVGAYTASVLACRKLLMNIAVTQGADEGKPFIFYVDYLATTGYVPPNGKIWVDHIRKKGNEATHEIALMKLSDAEELIVFVEMLLKFIYEFPAKIPKT
jgi:hypothetical protein